MKALFSLVLVFSSFAFGAPEHRIERRVRISSEVFQDRMESRFPIPQNVLDASQCVASIKIVKAGFIFAGEGSTGMVSCKMNGEWSAPSFFNVGGPSFGLQAGVQFVDAVWLFMTDYSRQILRGPSFKLGLDLSIAVGPLGQGGGTGVIPEAHVLTYNRTVGLFGGISINGLIMSHGPQRNREVYGDLRPAEILATPGSSAPTIVQPYVRALTRFAPVR